MPLPKSSTTMRRCKQVMGKRSVAQCGGGGKRQAGHRKETARLDDQRTSLYAWNSLNVRATELRCELTLTTGQTFRWRLIAPNMYDSLGLKKSPRFCLVHCFFLLSYCILGAVFKFPSFLRQGVKILSKIGTVCVIALWFIIITDSDFALMIWTKI